MVCEICGKEATRARYLHIDGKLVGGCNDCMSGKNPSTISTEQRWHDGPGYSFRASPAHIDHIRHRKLQSDGRTVQQNRR